jgi:hypothetical protein
VVQIDEFQWYEHYVFDSSCTGIGVPLLNRLCEQIPVTNAPKWSKTEFSKCYKITTMVELKSAIDYVRDSIKKKSNDNLESYLTALFRE